jgi:hypothetical protein
MTDRSPSPPTARRTGKAAPADWDRLQRALADLQQALQSQAVAVRDHRAALARLDGTISGLGDSCRSYHEALGRIDVAPLRKKSLMLAEIMDDYLRRRADAGPPKAA